MPGFFVVPPGAADQGGILNQANIPFWGLNDQGGSAAQGYVYAPDPWDSFTVADMVLPGICELRGLGVAAIDLIVKKAKGHTGARVTFGGYDPKQFEVACEIATRVQWELLQDVCDTLWRGQKSAPKDTEIALDVRHPDLARLRINQAVLIGMPPAERGSIEGAKVFKFRFQEYVAPAGKNVTKSANGSLSVAAPVQLHIGEAPSNAAPQPPSSNKANLRLKGPPQSAPEGA